VTELDRTLAAALDPLVPRADGPAEWQDVLRRAGLRTHRHRRRLVAAAGVAAVLVATPALAFRAQLHDFFAGQTRDRIEKDYFSLPLDGRVGGVPGPVERARRVTAWRRGDGSRITLAVSLVRRGGFCWRMRSARHFNEGGCVTEKKRASFTRPALFTSYPSGPSDPWVLSGSVTYAGARSLEVRYAHGGRQRISLIWISAPVDAGFFYFETAPGRKPTAVQLRDRAGTVVSRLSLAPMFPRRPPGP
jgi:hypothetical protein